MTDREQEIYDKIEQTYNTEKGKGFITHLLRSFLPISRSTKLMSNDKNLKLVDCITGDELCDVNTHFGLLMSDEGMGAMMDNFKASVKGIGSGEDVETPDSVKELKSKIKEIAVSCKKSDKVMSEETLGQLFNFYASEMLKGNGHINWIANNERGKEFIKSGKKSGYIENRREEKVVKKAVEHAKMSLGDMDVLRQLKIKMEKNE